MYAARLWKNTGYNGINIPDSPATLENLPYEDKPALDILTDEGLSSVRLHGTKSDFDNVDYVKIGGVYYKVFEPAKPLNGDTFELYLTCDGVTTAGGIFNIDFSDGISNSSSKQYSP